MHKLRELIPSANCLFTFEAAARHESFTRAAGELNITQPSVSRSVQQLEGWLDVTLFHRRHRAIELTAEGRRLYQELSNAFDHLYLTASTLQTSSHRESLNVSFSSTFISFWLAPRMNDFSRKYPEIRLHIDVSDREDKDLAREGFDISLRVGEGNWGSLTSWQFADEEVFPVCSPAYLENYGPIRSVADLPNHRLLQTDEPYRVRIAWKEWLNHNGVAATNLDYVLICTDPGSLLQSVLEGQGVSLGWKFLVERKLEEGQLVRPVGAVYRSGLGVYIIAPDTSPMKWSARVFRDWLLHEAEQVTEREQFPSTK